VRPDIILLDYMLPKITGLEVCQQIRTFSKVPIMMVSARSDEDEKIACLDAGADDYIVKPFSQRELIARMNVHLRRIEDSNLNRNPVQTDSITFDHFQINRSTHKVIVGGVQVTLTKKEFLILWLLCKQPNEVIARKFLIEQVWGYLDIDDDRVIDTHLNRIRSKLKEHTSIIQIRTIWGIGYKLEVKGA
jgi:DNA-binding response OmpR family regulator